MQRDFRKKQLRPDNWTISQDEISRTVLKSWFKANMDNQLDEDAIWNCFLDRPAMQILKTEIRRLDNRRKTGNLNSGDRAKLEELKKKRASILPKGKFAFNCIIKELKLETKKKFGKSVASRFCKKHKDGKQKLKRYIGEINKSLRNWADETLHVTSIPFFVFDVDSGDFKAFLQKSDEDRNNEDTIGYMISLNIRWENPLVPPSKTEKQLFDILSTNFEFAKKPKSMSGSNATTQFSGRCSAEISKSKLTDSLAQIVDLFQEQEQNTAVAISVQRISDPSKWERANYNVDQSLVSMLANELTNLFAGLPFQKFILVDNTTRELMVPVYIFEERESIASSSDETHMQRTFLLQCKSPFAQQALEFRLDIDDVIKNIRNGDKAGNNVLIKTSIDSVDAVTIATIQAIKNLGTHLPFLFDCHPEHRHDQYNSCEESINNEIGINRFGVNCKIQKEIIRERIARRYGLRAFEIVEYLFGEQKSEAIFIDIGRLWYELFESVFSKTSRPFIVVVQRMEHCDASSQQLLQFLSRNKSVSIIGICCDSNSDALSAVEWIECDIPNTSNPYLTPTTTPPTCFDELSRGEQILAIHSLLGWGTCRSWLRNICWFFWKAQPGEPPLKRREFSERFGYELKKLLSEGRLRVTSILTSATSTTQFDGEQDYVLRFVSHSDFQCIRIWSEDLKVKLSFQNQDVRNANTFLVSEAVRWKFLELLAVRIGILGSNENSIRFKYTVARLTQWWDGKLGESFPECQIDSHTMLNTQLKLRNTVAQRVKRSDEHEYIRRVSSLLNLIVSWQKFRGKETWQLGGAEQVATEAVVSVLANSQLNKRGEIENVTSVLEFADALVMSVKTITRSKKLLEKIRSVLNWKRVVFPVQRAKWAYFQRTGDFEKAASLAEELNKYFENKINLRSAEYWLEIQHLHCVSLFSKGDAALARKVASGGKRLAETMGKELHRFSRIGEVRGAHCPGGCLRIFEAYAAFRARRSNKKNAIRLGKAATEYATAIDDANTECVTYGYFGLLLLECAPTEIGEALNVVAQGIRRLEIKRQKYWQIGIRTQSSTRWLNFLGLVLLMLETLRYSQEQCAPEQSILKFINDICSCGFAVEKERRKQIATTIRNLNHELSKYSIEMKSLFEIAQLLAKKNASFKLSKEEMDTRKHVQDAGPFKELALLLFKQIS